MVRDAELVELVARRNESLAVEIKRWLDPNSKDGIAKIAKSCIALKNNNGGYLIIGFDDKSHLPDDENRPADIRILFHQDTIQRIVSNYASKSFECEVHYILFEDKEYPVILIPGGIKSPVATKSQLEDGSQVLIKNNCLYVRTINSNNTPSTSEPTHKDWERIIDICFDNREADIGKFIQRHVSGFEGKKITITIEDKEKQDEGDEKGDKEIVGVNSIIPPQVPTITSKERQQQIDRVNDFENIAQLSFKDVVKERSIELPPHGSLQITFATSKESTKYSVNQDFLNVIRVSNPNYTGWPLWVDSRNFRDDNSKPFVWKQAWQAFIYAINKDWFNHIDFWRIDPKGSFYHYRALEDDLKVGERAPLPLKELDFGMPIWRVAEALAIGQAFSRSLFDDVSEIDKLYFRFRWTGLKNRLLSSWASPDRYISPVYVTREDEIVSEIETKIDAPISSISELSYIATKPLFNSFSGFDIGREIVNELVKEMLSRKRT
jgi:hypothetical protein